MKKDILYILIILFFLAAGPGLQKACAQAPVINSFAPQKAWYGTDVYIQGSGFTGIDNMVVKFGAGTAKIIEIGATAIRVQVPAGATYGPITVLDKTTGLTAYSPLPFLLTFGGKENAAPQFGAPQKLTLNTGIKIYDTCTCDLDGDGRNDLAGSNEGGTSITTYLNNSTAGTINFPAAFPGRKEINAGKATKFISCGDLDGDGKADLVLTGAGVSQEVIFLRNTSTLGNINFAPYQLLSIGTKDWQKPLIHDLNGDGKANVILTNATDNLVHVLKNTSQIGNLSFDPSFMTFSVSAASTRGLRVKDVNNDGLADITASNYYGSKVYFLLNNSSAGNISFQAATTFTAHSGITNHELEDMDGDGKTDLITLDYFTNKVNVFLNNSTGTTPSFATTPQAFPVTGTLPIGLEIGDINGDKKPDLLIGLNGTSVANIFTNTSTPGNLSFTASTISSPEAGKFSNVQISDFDGDAIPDVVAADNGASAFFVFRNTTCIAPVISEVKSGDNITLNTVQSPPAADGTPVLSYQWYKDGVALGTDYKTENVSPGNYTVKISTPNCGTLTSAPFTANDCLGDLGNPAIEAAPQVCKGESFTLTVSPAVSGASYKWTNDNSGLTQTTTSNTLSITEADPELHAGTYTLTIEASCTLNLQSGVVVIHAKPAPAIMTDEALTACPGESRILRAEEGYTSYQWKKEGVNIASATSSSFTTAEGGSYTVEVKNEFGCVGESAAITLSVTENIEPVFDSPAVSCINQPVKFTTDFTLPPNTNATYSWDFGDGNVSSQNAPEHTYTQSGEGPYTVTLSLQYGSSNCTSTFSRSISIVDTREISLEAASAVFCAGDSVKVQVNGNVTAVKWSNGDTGLFTYAKTGGTLEADVTIVSGCNVSKSIDLEMLPAPLAEISADKTLAGVGESVQLQASGGVAYSWEPAEKFDNPSIPNPVVFPDKTTTYKVRVTGENGCTTMAEITIEFDSSFRVRTPKLFVPPADQYWKVGNIENFPDVSLSILNKFGRSVYEAFPYKNEWDGTEKGNDLTNGVYYYVFKDSSGNVIKTGSITLIR